MKPKTVQRPFTVVTSVINRGDQIMITWEPVAGAEIYVGKVAYTKPPFAEAEVLRTKKNSITIKTIGGKAIDQTKHVKYRVRAYPIFRSPPPGR